MRKAIDPRMVQKLAKPNFTYPVNDKLKLDLTPETVPTEAELKQEAEDSLDRLAELLKETVKVQSGIDKLLESRDKLYGDFAGQATISQKLKSVMCGSKNRDNLKHYQKEALELIQHKISRILNGDPDYIDSWLDIAGYATLVVSQLKVE